MVAGVVAFVALKSVLFSRVRKYQEAEPERIKKDQKYLRVINKFESLGRTFEDETPLKMAEIIDKERAGDAVRTAKELAHKALCCNDVIERGGWKFLMDNYIEAATITDNFTTQDIEQAAKVLEKATKKLLKRNLLPEY